MVFPLVCDIGAHRLQIRRAHRKSPVSRLPSKFCNLRETLLDPQVGTSLEFFHQIGLRNPATQLDQNVDMIGNPADQNGRAIEFFGDSSEKCMNLPANFLVGQKRESPFGGEDDVQNDAGQRLGHGNGLQPPMGLIALDTIPKVAERVHPLRGFPKKIFLLPSNPVAKYYLVMPVAFI